ncbi:MAG: BamA/TamA family outer membrane protein [Bacteroidetes bacterium]|nr:BamA/TamA family outer membrane protein [Bacteroidota bacterium]
MFCLILKLHGQKSYTLSVVNTDNPSFFKKLNYKKVHASKEFAIRETQAIYQTLLNEGYLAAAIDSIRADSVRCHAFISSGLKYKWVQLSISRPDESLMSRLGYGERLFVSRTFKYAELARMFDKVVTYFENNGYPFASVQLDSFSVHENELSAALRIKKNQFVKLDSLILEGNTKMNKKFMFRYLGIKEGMPYNEEAFVSASRKIKQLPFLAETKTPILKLTDKKNKLYLFLDKRNASQFDGIVGILPDDKGKTIFTGDVKIKLVNNIFHNGETFDINWRRLQSQTQDLLAHINYPYLVGLPVGVDYSIKLYRKDTSFIDINNALALQYYFNGLNNIKVFYKQRNANIISTSGLANVTVLPEYADVVTKAYGLGFTYEKFDYKFNPKRGIGINVQASVGNRVIKRNPKINDVAYAGLSLRTGQYQAEGNVVGYINLTKNHVLKLSTLFGSVFGNTVYKNELFRIGGLKTLRGFDEESIYASTYVIPSLEYRFLFEKNSNIFLFADGAWYENNSVYTYVKDTPYSFGAGINFETKAGIFTLSYGLGKQFGNSFDLRTGKIHAGLVAMF